MEHDRGAMTRQAWVDTNVDAILPGTRGPLAPVRPDGGAAPEPRMERKKRAQFERYLVKKLKKDGRPELYARLAASALPDASAGLQSSRVLVLERHGGAKRGRPDARPDDDLSPDAVGHAERVAPRGRLPRFVPDSVVDLHAAISSLRGSELNPLSSEDESVNESVGESAGEGGSDAETVHHPPEGHWAALEPPPRAFHVPVERPADVAASRAKLPVVAEEQRIVDTVMRNAVVFLAGETGSGKTTQLPQFLYEAGFGDAASHAPGVVVVTQPRRVAAVSATARVGHELGAPARVAHHVRHDSQTSRETRVKFATDGLLLREAQNDLMLARYSVVVVDEAHERNANTDVLLALLSRAVRLRNTRARTDAAVRPLRVVVMSATLDVDALLPLFSDAQWAPPVLRVDARQHAVAVHFARETPADYVAAAVDAVRRIDAEQPPGAVLVFLAGRAEIHAAMATLLRSDAPDSFFASDSDSGDSSASDPSDSDLSDSESIKKDSSDSESTRKDPFKDDSYKKEYFKKDFHRKDGNRKHSAHRDSFEDESRGTMHVLPLYAAMDAEAQMRVFEPPPSGKRLVVLATNVAETSLTIPGVRFVVDAGRAKERVWRPHADSAAYVVGWSSKAAAVQRAGRAGRTGPGTCFRLYSAAVFEREFPAHDVPEVMRMAVDGLVLQLRAMGIERPERFPLPSPPPAEAVAAADRRLELLGALEHSTDGRRVLSALGRAMAALPLPPVWASVAVAGIEAGVGSHAVRLAAVASLGSPFADTRDESVLGVRRRLAGKPPVSDVLHWLAVFARWESFGDDRAAKRDFASSAGVSPRWLEEAAGQVRQVQRDANRQQLSAASGPKTADGVRTALCALVSQALRDRVATRHVGQGRTRHPTYQLADGRLVHLHPSSALYRLPPATLVYGELIERDEPVDGIAAWILHVTVSK